MMNIDLTNIGIIERDTFRDCSSLKSVSVDDNSSTKVNSKNTIDKKFIKQQCDKGLLKNIVLPNSLTAIGNNAFSGCKSLESVDIPANVVRIGTEVFMNCENLNTIIFKDNTTGASMGKIVGEAMFLNCKSLKTVLLSNDITAIETRAFYGCNSLKTIIVKRGIPPKLEDYVFPNLNIDIYVPQGCEKNYQNAKGWSVYASKIQPIS